MTQPPAPRYVTLEHVASISGDTLSVLASYQLVNGVEIVELAEAIDEWGFDRLDHLPLHEYEHLRLTALSLFHDEESKRPDYSKESK